MRLKKLIDALGSVPLSFMTAMTLRFGSVRLIRA